MKKIIVSSLLLLLFAISYGCDDKDDNDVPAALEINDFVWKGMNLYYLWQEDVPDLADDRFANQTQLNTFLEAYASPVDLFNHLRVASAIDRFSVIYSDYTVLEGVLSGNTLNNGMDYGLKYTDTSQTTVFGWVRYIIPNSDAATKDIHRGDIFYAIDGVPLTNDNYKTLLAANTYTINLADYSINAGVVTLTPNGQSVTLTKTNLAENPILMSTVINQGTHNIGYLMYNGFYSSYDGQLNTAFGSLVSQNVTDLVLDLRYNSGGSVATATKLASMITGQFTGQLFAKEQWNDKAQSYFLANSPGSLENKFFSGLNGLHLNKVYILTTKATASASELVVNCLKPYIDVVQIGDLTTGKNVGSITMYDSPTYTKTNVNPHHKYAMQPIVLKVVDKNGFGDYTAGIAPTILLPENLNDLGILGDVNEPLLNAAINQIIASGKMLPQVPAVINRDFTDAKSINPLRSEMYVEHR
ncbi:S41 family peptidase [Flavobacterium wongokense]|uniref:S41 family peptidase n=1 Tax=Flavobacterium wongokense TaxID=2910674 RepID=UPI001F27FD22|nr:S41 family peptidase [Flavobacterium sp. WG47]MCF6132823.1 S41 family peptidase [Flavobacterium sp. WG47]